MTPEQQRIAIAEACGWRYAGPLEAKEFAIACWYAPGDMEWHQRVLPDYLNDLNAMHEAETVLDCNEWEVWHRIVGEWPCDIARLSAAQRGEAFLRALNRWRKEP